MTQQPELDRERALACLGDRWWRLNNLYWIVDRWGKRVLFQPNAAQAKLDDELHYLNLILKSRQHGITTWACIRALDAILFIPYFRAGIVAHTAGDAAKFFQHKVLFAYDNLPGWIRAMRPTKRRDMRDGVLELSNQSSIEVSVSHRGGTLNFLHVSEYGPMCSMYPERASEVASGALNTIAPPKEGERPNIVVIESTAYGSSGDFYDRAMTAQDTKRLVEAGNSVLTALDYKFHFFAWWMDPQNTMDPEHVPVSDAMSRYFDAIEEEFDTVLTRGQRAWYVKKAIEQGDKMRREHPSTPKEAFQASVDGSYYGTLMEKAEAEGRVGNFPFMPGNPVYTFWDIGRRDATAIWFMQENGGWFDFIAYFEESGEQAARFAKEVQRRRDELDYVYGDHYLPHDIDVTEWVGTGDSRTRKEILESLGVKPIIVVPRIPREQEGIDMVRRMLHRCRFDAVNCGPPRPGGEQRGGIEAMKHFRKDWKEETKTFRDKPAETWANHGADAFRMFAQAYSAKRPQKEGRGNRQELESWKTL